MSKSLRSIKGATERQRVIVRRLLVRDKEKQGLGYWAAFDAKKYIDRPSG